MAFRTGTQVRPELGRADVSGFARAGMITGQALANLGQDIGEGIEKYQRNKQITATSLAQLEAVGSARPDAYAALKGAGGDVSKSISNIEKGDYKQKDVLSALGAMNAYLGTQAAEQESRLREAQIGAMEREAKASSLSKDQLELQSIMAANPDLTMSDAINIQTGISKLVTNPVTGRTVIANIATGEEKPLRRSEVTDTATSAALAPDPDAEPSSLNLYKIAETTTGFFPALAAAAQRFTGQVGIDVAEPELLENMQTFQTAQSDLRRSMRTAPKFLASEMAMLDKELDIAPSAFKDPTTLMAQIRSVDKSIRNRLEGIAQAINDPNLPADEVSAALRLQKDLVNFLRNLNVPQGAEEVDVEKLYQQAGGVPEISDIAAKYLNQ